jgi:hypothetical protein
MDGREAASLGESSQDERTLAGDTGDESPPYTANLGMHPKSFTLRGALLYTPSGATHQLSSTLSQTGHSLLLRSLSAKESSQVATSSSHAVPFDRSSVLYEIFWSPLNTKWLEIRGRRRNGVPGSVRMKHGFRTWHVVQQAPGRKTAEQEMITVKRYGRKPGKSRLGWRVLGGEVIAYEDKDDMGEHEYQTALKIVRDLDDSLMELLLACWVGRLWFRASLGKAKRKGLRTRKKMRVMLPKLNVFRKVSSAIQQADRDQMVKNYLDCAPLV